MGFLFDLQTIKNYIGGISDGGAGGVYEGGGDGGDGGEGGDGGDGGDIGTLGP